MTHWTTKKGGRWNDPRIWQEGKLRNEPPPVWGLIAILVGAVLFLLFMHLLFSGVFG